MVRTLLADVASAIFPGVCPGCGRPAEPLCAACTAKLRPAPGAPAPPGVDAWVAAFAYDGVARELIARAKYRGRHAVLGWLAAAMVGAIGDLTRSVDQITWVPTADDRRRARGFDHARALARYVGRDLGCPVVGGLRRGPGPPQTGLPLAARRVGPAIRATRTVRGHVLVVDDVATTGASLAAAAAALRCAGATRVLAVTAARTPSGRGRG